MNTSRSVDYVYPGKMTISGRPEFGLEDVPWTLAAYRFDVLRTSIDPKMVQILTKIFKNHINPLLFHDFGTFQYLT